MTKSKSRLNRPTKPTKPTKPSTQPLPRTPGAEDMKSWNVEKVLQWIQQRDPNILEGGDVDNFKKARITGKTFLDFDLEFLKSWGLLLAPLRDLAHEVNEADKRSNQTADRKRSGDEIDASEASISPKRIRQEDPLSELATKANERRKRIRDMITKINIAPKRPSNSATTDNPLPRAVDRLSDPSFKRQFPFPSVFAVVPTRFKSGGTPEEHWSYMGRTKFKELLQTLNEVRKDHSTTTAWLYGTQGYGKSHLLAALVCYLAAQDERVVYIPDCRVWLRDSVGYMQAAMLFAWADDITTQNEIMTLNDEEKIENFIKRQTNVIFVIDQMNALKTDGKTESPTERDKRTNLCNWLMRFTVVHKSVFSSSANYRDYHDQNQQQNSNNVLYVYGGLSRAEMDQWWKQRAGIDLAGYKHSDVEDITGRIPLLLDKCAAGGKIDLGVEDLRKIYSKAVTFVQRARNLTTGQSSRWRYVKYVKACFCGGDVPYGENPDLIDHQYFFQVNMQGNVTCGLARDAVADELLPDENFADTDFLLSLPQFIDNEAMVGFMMEHAILSSIQSKGLKIGANLGTSMELRLLEGSPDFGNAITDKPVLYRPRKFNFRAIDGVIILVKSDDDKEKKKLSIFPFQITVTPHTHSDSRELFFKHFGWWITDLPKFDVELEFLWITPECRDSQEYPADTKLKRPKHIERYIPFEVVDKEIWETYGRR